MPGNRSVADALYDAITPLETTEPAIDGDGLHALGDALADHRVVGLGEATHGTREFFELKHRIVRNLVEAHDVRLFGIEASFGETLAVNDYVCRGDGDPESVVGEMVFWTWDTDEVREFVSWLREFNAGRPSEDQVKFYGFDAQFVGASARRLDSYLADAAPDLHNRVAADLDSLGDDVFKAGDESAVSDQLSTARSVVDALAGELDQRRSALVENTSEREWRLARQHVTAIRQATEFVATHHHESESFSGEGVAAREQAMADNVNWILDHEPHGRIAIWAHNAHVKRSETYYPEADATVDQMGAHIADRHGNDYYALCFDFDRGGFQAIGDLPESDAETDEERGLREFVVDAAPDDTLAAAFAETGHSPAFLDVKAAADDTVLGEWLDASQRLRSIGALYEPDETDDYFEAFDLRGDLDGVLFVAETTRARPLDG